VSIQFLRVYPPAHSAVHAALHSGAETSSCAHSDARAADSAWAATAPRLDPVSYSETVVTTLDTGRWLTVGSLASFMSASSYCGSVCTGSFARIATTL
jgi:hypothetical protein